MLICGEQVLLFYQWLRFLFVDMVLLSDFSSQIMLLNIFSLFTFQNE